MRIAVLYGGTSPEREVSLVSGRAVALALAERGHEVLLVDPALGDRPIGPAEAAAAVGIDPTPTPPVAERGAALEAVTGVAVSSADVVFLTLHGGSGENGTIQGLLEMAGKPYTGSGVLASALAMDKRAAKTLFGVVGVPTPAWRIVAGTGPSCERPHGSPRFPDDLAPELAGEAVAAVGGLPVVVKPNDQGSTVGLTVVREPSNLVQAIELAASYSAHVLIERYVDGREMTVAVLGDEALPVVEIVPKSGLYDYEAKYTKGMSDYVCPADVPPRTAAALTGHALAAFAALGCCDYARVDFLVTPDGDSLCLEVNTLPGMTELSLVPMAASAAGIGFEELVERIVQSAHR